MFDVRANPCVFTRYPYGIKGYKVYNLHTRNFFVSWDVLFYEDYFPFKEISVTSDHVVLPNVMSNCTSEPSIFPSNYHFRIAAQHSHISS